MEVQDIIDPDIPDIGFDPSQWIGVGKTFPKATEITQSMSNAYTETYTIPLDISTKLLWDRNHPVTEFTENGEEEE